MTTNWLPHPAEDTRWGDNFKGSLIWYIDPKLTLPTNDCTSSLKKSSPYKLLRRYHCCIPFLSPFYLCPSDSLYIYDLTTYIQKNTKPKTPLRRCPFSFTQHLPEFGKKATFQRSPMKKTYKYRSINMECYLLHILFYHPTILPTISSHFQLTLNVIATSTVTVTPPKKYKPFVTTLELYITFCPF